jgi:predicted nucleic acid-binding protein
VADQIYNAGGVHVIVTDENTVELTMVRRDPLTPGEANAIATALQEAALVATSNAKEEAARKQALAADRGPKHEEMF